MIWKPLFIAAICVHLFAVVSGFSQQAAQTSCIHCHTDPEFFDEDRIRIVRDFTQGAHSSVDLSCHDCHGGNPDPELSDDMVGAMDPEYSQNPYIGAVERTDIPGFCGKCHSDPVFMKQYRPEVRVDQEEEYWTSQHGRLLKKGDTRVAVCVDCHGVHGIKRIRDSNSPVFPKNVAETCSDCHSDAEYMAVYNLPDGRPLPTNQYAGWLNSVHGRAMLEKEDLSAPTCNDCHGNHGATPPGLESITYICGQCHSREAELFRASSKHEGFQEHNEMLSGGGSCADCHEFSGEAPTITSFSECDSCHGNHFVVRPSLAMFSPLPETPCAICHEGPPELTLPRAESNYRKQRDDLVREGEANSLTGVRLFDWLVDRTYSVPNHLQPSSTAENSAPRPEFARLFEKFRIGKTEYSVRGPSGETHTHRVIRCESCHAMTSDTDNESDATRMAESLIRGLSELTAKTAGAERILLRARRGGVEIREVLAEIDNAVKAQIELQVLVHTFSADPEGPFIQKYNEGIEYANVAVEKGRAALSELKSRRQGLLVSLVFIALVLVGLWLKIRQIG